MIDRTSLTLFKARSEIMDVINESISDPVVFSDGDSALRAVDEEGWYASRVTELVGEMFAEVSMFNGRVIFNTPLYPVAVAKGEDGVVRITCRFFDMDYEHFDPRPVTVCIYDVTNPEVVADFIMDFSSKKEG